MFTGDMNLLSGIKSQTELSVDQKIIRKIQKFIYTERSIKDNSRITPQSYKDEIYSIYFLQITSKESFEFDEMANTITRFIGKDNKL